MARPRSRPPIPNRANVLLIGGGGREHALAWKLAQSPRLGALWFTDPANAGFHGLGEACPVPLDFSKLFQFQRWCDRSEIDLVVVGPEAPLAKGITDALESDRRRVFGPTRAAAQIEADKAFCKQVMRQAAIPTAEARIFKAPEDARAFVQTRDEPCVVKASGLAAGKGAVVCDTTPEALEAIDRIMVRREFGEAGAILLVEEKLTGQEASLLALVDGRSMWLLDPCQDHKQAGEGDSGPNTGGMGAYCPTPLMDPATLGTAQAEIIVPVVDALRREGIEYRGVLYAGLMLTPAGIKALEFNCRFGDPECQAIIPRLAGDLIEILWASCTPSGLNEIDIAFDPRTACCVVMCSEGYPGPYEKGREITGIDEAEALGGDGRQVIVFHAGTRHDDEGRLVTAGGRVLGVTALAEDLQSARDLANAACDRIRFEGAFFRRDIGDRVLCKT
jgi:phosphoribosylamine--glycine ligase